MRPFSCSFGLPFLSIKAFFWFFGLPAFISLQQRSIIWKRYILYCICQVSLSRFTKEESGSAHLSFLLLAGVAASFDDVVSAVEEEFAETVESVALPVFDTFPELVHGNDALFFVHGLVCALENGRCGLDALGDLGPFTFV
jgi:hypothetical protein